MDAQYIYQQRRRRGNSASNTTGPRLGAPSLNVNIPIPEQGPVSPDLSSSGAITPTATTSRSLLSAPSSDSSRIGTGTRSRRSGSRSSGSEATVNGSLSPSASIQNFQNRMPVSLGRAVSLSPSNQISSPSLASPQESRASAQRAGDQIQRQASQSTPHTDGTGGGNPVNGKHDVDKGKGKETGLDDDDDDQERQLKTAEPEREAEHRIYGLNEAETYPYYVKRPHYHSLQEDEHFRTNTLFWSKAAIWGAVPNSTFKSHSATLVPNGGLGGVIWVIGGHPDDSSSKSSTVNSLQSPSENENLFRNVFTFDTSSMRWSHPTMRGECPPPLRAHTAVLMDNRNIIFFGGGSVIDTSTYYNDLWMLDTKLRLWSKLPVLTGAEVPSKRRSHSAVLYDNKMYIFGGGTGSKALNDLWVLDLTDLSKLKWQKIEYHNSDDFKCHPCPRGYHTATLVMNKMIVFGGTASSEPTNVLDDIWMLDLDDLEAGWIDLTPTPPQARLKRAFHTTTIMGQYLFVVGGHDGSTGRGYSYRIYAFDLIENEWALRDARGRIPRPRGYHSTVYADSRLWVIGGMGYQESKERDTVQDKEKTRVSLLNDVYVLDLGIYSYLPNVLEFEITLPEVD